MFEDGRNTSFVDVLDSYQRTLRLGDHMWQRHFEFLLLGYGAYSTFADLCKANLPDIPDQHIAQMVAGIDVILFKPDAELRRLARLAIETGADSAFVEGRTPEEIDAELAQTEAGRAWLEELEEVKDPWFNMATGDGLYHYYKSWLDDPSIPYASLIGHMNALKAGEQIDRPTEEIQRERERLAGEYRSLLEPEVQQGFGALLVKHGFLEQPDDMFMLGRHEVASALDELVLAWASGGDPLGPHHWPPIVKRRRELLAKLADWTPPPALGVTPEAVTDPMTIMLWGVTTQRVQEWARQVEGGSELVGAAASPGVVEGPARVVRTVDQIADVREGEILVTGSTSPAWAPIFSKIKPTVTAGGGVMSHAAIVCREYGLPAVVGTGRATSQIRTGQIIRVDGSAGSGALPPGR